MLRWILNFGTEDKTTTQKLYINCIFQDFHPRSNFVVSDDMVTLKRLPTESIRLKRWRPQAKFYEADYQKVGANLSKMTCPVAVSLLIWQKAMSWSKAMKNSFFVK